MYSRPTAPKSIGGVLDDIFKLYAAALPQTWPIALASALLVMVPTIYMSIQFGAKRGTPQQMLEMSMGMMSSPGFWGAYLLIVLISIVFSVAMMIRVAAVANGEDGSFASAISGAFRLVPRTLGVSFLYGLAVCVGMILLVVPGVILMVSLMLAFPLVVIEDAGAVDSLSRSRQLVKGDWWRTVTILTVAFIVAYLLLFCVSFIAGIVSSTGQWDPLTTSIVINVVTGLLNVLILPLYSAAILSIYFDLKLRKEGDDLVERVASLSKA